MMRSEWIRSRCLSIPCLLHVDAFNEIQHINDRVIRAFSTDYLELEMHIFPRSHGHMERTGSLTHSHGVSRIAHQHRSGMRMPPA